MAFRSKSGLRISELISPVFLTAGILAIINRYFLRYTGIAAIDYYFNDFCSVPVTLYLSSVTLGFIYGIFPFPLGKTRIFCATLLFILVFEIALPLLNPSRYTADIIDALVFAAGGVFYYLLAEK
ncbi:MAG: hypothetical protein KDC13_07490 [Bacteroidetes bacterium]|nr:hypothetical protein [Bacteroidota bacterium]